MRTSRFSEEQIIGILHEHEAGGGTTALCRRHGISEQTLYRWKRKYGGLQVNETKRLRTLEAENAGRTSSIRRISPWTNRCPVSSGRTSNSTGSCPPSASSGASVAPSVPPAPVIRTRTSGSLRSASSRRGDQ